MATNDIISIAKRAFTRFFEERPGPEFTEAIIDYRERAAEYSNESKHLDDWKTSAERDEKVCMIRSWYSPIGWSHSDCEYLCS